MFPSLSLQYDVHPSNDSSLLVPGAIGSGMEMLAEPLTPCVVYEKPREFLDCSSFTWGVVPPDESDGGCSAEPYIGGPCKQQLLEWQECVLGRLDFSLVTPVDKNSSRLNGAVLDLQVLLGNFVKFIYFPSDSNRFRATRKTYIPE